MARKCGRPPKSAGPIDAEQKIIAATIALIKREGADAVTVRKVVEETGLSIGTFYHHFKSKDDLLMYFVRETSFDDIELKTPQSEFFNRMCELYFHLINRYIDLGKDFIKSFYTTSNRALSAYMSEEDGTFAEGTVMARCQQEIEMAMAAGILKGDTDAHELSMDICTIVKGCVFEWALTDGTMDIHGSLLRILQRFISAYMTYPASAQ